jgi:hypothetical protein
MFINYDKLYCYFHSPVIYRSIDMKTKIVLICYALIMCRIFSCYIYVCWRWCTIKNLFCSDICAKYYEIFFFDIILTSYEKLGKISSLLAHLTTFFFLSLYFCILNFTYKMTCSFTVINILVCKCISF